MACSMTSAGAAMNKSFRYDQTRAFVAACSPFTAFVILWTSAWAAWTAASTPAALAMGVAGSPWAQP
eukprot:14526616-Alexandrium_andersonii.AAC.1